MKNKRNNFLDFLKGLAIILVVLGHNIQYGSGDSIFLNSDFYNTIAFRLIYSFHMPLFAIISGYLFYWSKKKYSDREILKKKINSLLVPILSFSIINTGISLLKHLYLYRYLNVSIILETFKTQLFTSLWFLSAILFSTLLVLALEKLKVSDTVKNILSIVLLLILLVVPNFFDLYLYIYIYPYFIAGYLINKHNLLVNVGKLNKHKYLTLTVLLISFIALFSIYNYDSFIYTSKINILAGDSIFRQLIIDVYRWLIGFAGSALIIYSGKLIYDKFEDKKFVKLVEKVGTSSLGIYVTNTYMVYIFIVYIGYATFANFTKYLSPNVFIWLIETVITMIVFYYLTKLIEKIPILSRLVLGKKKEI